MTAREKRMLKRYAKVVGAALLAQLTLWVQQGTPPVDWKFFFVPTVAAFLLAVEKGIQREKK